MLKQILGIIYAYVDGIEPFVLLFSAVLYLIHFFLYNRFQNSRIPNVAVTFIAVSAALTVVIVANRFL